MRSCPQWPMSDRGSACSFVCSGKLCPHSVLLTCLPCALSVPLLTSLPLPKAILGQCLHSMMQRIQCGKLSYHRPLHESVVRCMAAESLTTECFIYPRRSFFDATAECGGRLGCMVLHFQMGVGVRSSHLPSTLSPKDGAFASKWTLGALEYVSSFPCL